MGFLYNAGSPAAAAGEVHLDGCVNWHAAVSAFEDVDGQLHLSLVSSGSIVTPWGWHNQGNPDVDAGWVNAAGGDPSRIVFDADPFAGNPIPSSISGSLEVTDYYSGGDVTLD